jgi:hypothetical protein
MPVVPLALSVVNAPVDGVVEPTAPGDAKVEPPNDDAFRLGTFVVDAMTSGAVPVASVDVICPVADIVVAATVLGVVAPIVAPLIVPAVIAAVVVTAPV